MRKVRMMLLALLLGLGTMASAQMISPVDFMRNNPRNVFANPAFFTADYGYFDMALGGINIGVQNIGLKYRKFFKLNNKLHPVVLDLNEGVASMRRNNYLNTNVAFDIFNCGRATKHGYFTYSHRFREMETFRYNREFFELAVNGNASFMGEDHPARANYGVAARGYQEFNFGYQMSLTEKLNIGARFKFLMGYADAKSKAMNFKLVTDPDTYALSASGAIDVRATIPYQLSMHNGDVDIVDSRFNIANLFKNYGGGIDLGAEYKINDQIGVAAAVNDLGFIRWNNFSVRFVGQVNDAGDMFDEGSFVFQGLTTEQVQGFIDDPHYFSKLMDTIVHYFDLSSEALTGYTSGLNTTMMVRGYYDLTPEHRFSAQLTGYCSGIGLRPALTLAYTGSFQDKYDVVATYTMMPGNMLNLGVGLSANLGGSLFYIATNNVFGFINPANTSSLHIQFGLSFTADWKEKREDKIVIREKQLEEEQEEQEEQY